MVETLEQSALIDTHHLFFYHTRLISIVNHGNTTSLQLKDKIKDEDCKERQGHNDRFLV